MALSTRVHASAEACGCETGAIALAASLWASVVARQILGVRFGKRDPVVWGAFCAAAGFTGKLVGSRRARVSGP